MANTNTNTKKTQKIDFIDIVVDENKQFRVGSYQISEDPKAIDRLERSIKAYGLSNHPTVEPTPDGKYSLVDGFHRSAAWKRIWKQAGVNNPKNPWAQITVKVRTFANDCERDTYKFEANRHKHGQCTANLPGDVERYLIKQARNPQGCFGVVNPTCQVSGNAFKAALITWAKSEVPEWDKRTREKVIEAVLSHMGVHTTPAKFRGWLKEHAIIEMKKHFSQDWDGLASMDLSNDKKVLCGTVSYAEHHVKPGIALNKLISELGTSDWTQIKLPNVRLVGYVPSIPSSMTEDKLDKKRVTMQSSVKRMNEFCRNNVPGVNGDLIEYYEFPQKMGKESQIKRVF